MDAETKPNLDQYRYSFRMKPFDPGMLACPHCGHYMVAWQGAFWTCQNDECDYVTNRAVHILLDTLNRLNAEGLLSDESLELVIEQQSECLVNADHRAWERLGEVGRSELERA
jgi:ssDNA-binding Zn-finger/Zn-ribbon topoisomerase 1